MTRAPRKAKTADEIEAERERAAAEEEQQKAAAEEERQLWITLHHGPALTVNRMGIRVIPYNGGVRLSFAEQYEDGPVFFRTGVVMSEWNAYQLWELLGGTDVVKQWIDSQAAAAAATVEADDGTER